MAPRKSCLYATIEKSHKTYTCSDKTLGISRNEIFWISVMICSLMKTTAWLLCAKKCVNYLIYHAEHVLQCKAFCGYFTKDEDQLQFMMGTG